MKLLGVADNAKVKRSEQNGMTLGDTLGVTTNLIFVICGFIFGNVVYTL